MLPKFDPRVVERLRAQKRLLVIGLICSGLAAAIEGGMALLVTGTIGAIEQNQMERLWLFAGLVVGAYSLRYVLVRGQITYLGRAGNSLMARLREEIFGKLQRLPVSYFNDQRAGNIQSVLTNDVNTYQNAIQVVKDSIDGPIKVTAGLFVIFYLQWKLALISFLFVPIMVIVIQRNARKIKSAQAEVQKSLGSLMGFMSEHLQGHRIIKAFGAESHVLGRFDESNQATLDRQNIAVRRTAVLKPTVEWIGAVALAITVLICGWLVARGEFDVAGLTGFIYALNVINMGFRSIGSLNQTYAQIQAATDRIHAEVLDVQTNTPDSAEARQLAESLGRVEFRNVGFRYPDGTQAIQDVSFVIEPGESLALVGPSGAGKSTIADLLLRFYDPTDGTILYDGVDIRELDAEWYRRQIGVVPQSTFLFAGPISENLRLGNPGAEEEDLREALDSANALNFVQAMPEGIETALGERGVRMSGGEGQRIAIARALVRRPKVLLLDEATSNLDAHSEQVVSRALDQVMGTCTTLMIAHRLTTAARADRIVVLRQGQVMEQGSHDALMADGGAYAAMYRAFTSGLIDEEIG